jgi:moderate conductance mechanosensitive channel
VLRTRALVVVAVAALLPPVAVAAPACAQQATAPTSDVPGGEDVRTLIDLLGKPDVQAWLKANSQPATGAQSPSSEGAAQLLGGFVDSTRISLRHLASAIPRLPAQFAVMRKTLAGELSDRGFLGLLGPLIAFALLGALAEALFQRSAAELRRRITELPLATIEQQLSAVSWRTLYGIGIVGVFAAGSIGAFLVFDWPPLLQTLLLTYLIAVFAARLTMAIGRVVLAPDAERFRLLPMSTPTARYWLIWSATLVGAFYFAKGTFRLVPVLGADLDTRTLVGSALSVALLGLTLSALWRRPSFDGRPPTSRARDGWTWLLSAYLAGVWLTVFTGKTAPFDIGIVLLLVFLAMLGLRVAFAQLLRSAPAEPLDRIGHPFAVMAFHRGLRLAVIVGGALSVAYILGLDLTALAASDTLLTRAARAALDIAIIALVAEFVWQLVRLWIDQRMTETVAGAGDSNATGMRRRQRLHTFLPILRHVVLVLVILVAGLTALSTIGVAIGPLIAGAGVFGLAIGLGAQSLVKDIIAGLFFLFDDAFRIGEYIESGNIKGTVEGFSLRSVKLRHQHGAIHTVPFGTLSTITNCSRDWTIDKLAVNVAYDTDLELLKRTVKEAGRELKADPLYAPDILQSLKMQGVETFGEYGLKVVLKMMIRPGDQTLVRWRARTLIKRAFDRAGIKFASPTVAVIGGAAGGDAAGAAATMGLDLTRRSPSGAAA